MFIVRFMSFVNLFGVSVCTKSLGDSRCVCQYINGKKGKATFFNEGIKHVTVIKLLINLWPSVRTLPPSSVSAPLYRSDTDQKKVEADVGVAEDRTGNL